MSIESILEERLSYVNKEHNDTEKTIALQLISLAIFIITLLGAFITSSRINILSSAVKVIILIDLILLFISIILGVIHLLAVMQMWNRTNQRIKDAQEAIQQTSVEADKPKIANTILAKIQGSGMAFFYLQLATMAIGVAILVGIITDVLFR